MQYVGVRFFSEFKRMYTYKCNIRRIKENDFVIVPTQTGNTVAKVTATKLPTPPFECKEVIKKIEL